MQISIRHHCVNSKQNFITQHNNQAIRLTFELVSSVLNPSSLILLPLPPCQEGSGPIVVKQKKPRTPIISYKLKIHGELLSPCKSFTYWNSAFGSKRCHFWEVIILYTGWHNKDSRICITKLIGVVNFGYFPTLIRQAL